MTESDLALLALIGLLVVGYLVSLKLNPWVKCSRCGNKPKGKGWFFGHAHHFCAKCQGTGQQLRFGRNFIFGRPKSAGDR